MQPYTLLETRGVDPGVTLDFLYVQGFNIFIVSIKALNHELILQWCYLIAKYMSHYVIHNIYIYIYIYIYYIEVVLLTIVNDHEQLLI